VIEGMIIGAYAIGASRGYYYIREEYPLAIEITRHAVDQARQAGLLGANILGTGMDFDIEVVAGAGSYVCGEETALIASIEGGRGHPRARPPFPANQGLFGKPTNTNNVETWANVPRIFQVGPEAYAALGTATSKGTKIFSLSGSVRHTGLVEVPMGVTLRQIIYDIGGGLPPGRKFKAALVGGPCGGMVPEQCLDLPIDYETLKPVGAMMGCGGIIVLDDRTCMVDMARNASEFARDESCGKCVPCRVGNNQLGTVLDRVAGGQGRMEDISLIEQLSAMIDRTSLCGMAPNPVRSTVRYFRQEYEEHVRSGRCPMGICQASSPKAAVESGEPRSAHV
jgi:NADH:ubiquinone oxidoreductase subunit F (NADH-binding)